jgi:hypothetical protein
VLEVQHAAYAIEAQLIGYPALPPAHETLATLQECGEEVWLCEEDGELLGAVGLEHADGELLIARLFMAPSAFRHGLGPSLSLARNLGWVAGERLRTAPDRWKPPGGGFQSWPRQDGQGYVP